jgi:hypothetical protein
MRAQLEQRLAELKAQFEHGRKVLGDLEAQEAALRNTLLRISGAIEVIEEEFARDAQNSQPTAAPQDGDPRAAAAVERATTAAA